MIKKVFNTDADRRRTVTNLPIGSVMMWHSTTPPSSSWLLCNGQEIPIASYTLLYNLITANGTVFPYGNNTNGSGAAGSSHFRLPNMQDRFIMSPVKTGSNPGTGYTASTGGSNTHTHSFVIPTNNNYSLSESAHGHSVNMGTINSAGSHNHAFADWYIDGYNYAGTYYTSNTNSTNVLMAATGGQTMSFNQHNHSVSYTANSDGAHDHGGTLTSYIFGASFDVAIDSSHGHTATLTGQSQTPTEVSHIPANLKVHYLVLAA